MKIKDMLNGLIKEESNRDDICIIPEDMLYDMKLQDQGYISLEGSERFKCYWLAKHICTDTWVGLRCYLLDDKPVAMSAQSGRKCDEDFAWVSKEAFDNTRQFVLSLLDDEEVDFTPDFLDMEEEMGEGYQVHFVGQLLTKQVMYDNCMVEVTKEDSRGYENLHEIEIKHPTKGLMNIDIRDILVPWNA